MSQISKTSSTALALDPCKDHLSEKILSIVSAIPGASELTVTAQDIYAMMEKPPEENMGDFALPCFRFAKALKLPPPKIATMLAEGLKTDTSGWVERTAVVNAFLNIYVNKSHMAAAIIPKALDGKLFDYPIAPKCTGERVMVEFSQPNTHKEFHVGHMRNLCLGSALVNLFRYCGYHGTAVNYFGDEGTHIAKCLWMMKRTNATTPPGVDKGAWLGSIYVEATKALDEAKDDTLKKYEAEISDVLRGIESKSGPWHTLWLETKEWSLKAFRDVYKWVNIDFDRDFFESEVSQESQSIVEEYLAKGVFKEDQGAIGVDLSDYKLGFMLARKRDGNTLYATKDLALARHKFDQFKIDRNIYVVGSEQAHHFKQVFKTLELVGFPQASKCFHLSYGMVTLPSGKMSSRLGNTVPFMTLKDNMLAEIHAILAKYKDEWTAAEINDTAKKICIGAIKYGMLQSDPTKEIVFDMKDWLSFDGNTGPYLMYGYSRSMSVIRKAQELGHKPWSASEAVQNSFQLTEPSEQELLRFIYDFNTVVQESCEHYRPSHLCTHLFSMCKTFSRFYADVPILKAADETTIRMRLSLIDGFARTLKQGLALLGITPPERM